MFSFLPFSSKANFQRFNPATPLDTDDIIVNEPASSSPRSNDVSRSPLRQQQRPFRSPAASTSALPPAPSADDDDDAQIAKLLRQAQEKRRRLEELSILTAENIRLEQRLHDAAAAAPRPRNHAEQYMQQRRGICGDS